MMNTRKLTAVLLALALSLAAQAAFAQAEESPGISFENGFQACYKFSGSSVGSALNFGFGFGLSDKVQAQVSFVKGDAVFDSYSLLGLSYALGPRIGVTMTVGNGTASGTVAGIGLYSVLMSRNVSGSLQTSLKLKLNYLAPAAAYAQGIVAFGLSVGVGI